MLVQDAIAKTLEERKNPHPQIDVDKAMLEANFLMRSVIGSIQQDRGLQHALSLVWKFLVMHMDVLLAKEQLKLDGYQATFRKRLNE